MNSYEELIELLKEIDKNQLRLLRNSFYAKNGYVFKDSSLN
ncbi:MAG: YARHG domain-containing protein, partial [Treponema sp.]|nr:YARHG domain-containing protein [Treponema sp.]